MGKKDKIREGLENLFKARGEEIGKSKHIKKPAKDDFKKEQINGFRDNEMELGRSESNLKIQQKGLKAKQKKKTVKMPSNMKIPQQVNGFSKNIETKKAKNFNDKLSFPQKVKQQHKIKAKENSTDSKTKTFKASKVKHVENQKDTSEHPRGYFVMNHNADQSKLHNASTKHKTKHKVAAKIMEDTQQEFLEQTTKRKNNNKSNGTENETQQSRKRKANAKLKQPQSKVLKKQNEDFFEETSSESAVTAGKELKELSKFTYYNEISDESSFVSETDTTEDYSDSSDDDNLSVDSDEDETYSFDSDSDDTEYSFESNENDDFDDTYSETSQSDSDISFSATDSFESIHDPDYELPRTVLEDHIIHKGLAVKHDISTEYELQFDEHNESAQIVELPSIVNEVKQHVALNVEHLRTLESKFIESIKISNNSNTAAANTIESDDCPELVPIEEVDFRLWTSGIEMDDEIFSECSDNMQNDTDEESITAAEGNINDKYLKNNECSTTDSEDNELDYESYDEGDLEVIDEIAPKKHQKALNMKADIIVSKQHNFVDFKVPPLEQDVNEQLSLGEIIAQTQGLVDVSNVTIKTAIINENFDIKPNLILDEIEEMRDCAASPTMAVDTEQALTSFENIDDSLDALETIKRNYSAKPLSETSLSVLTNLAEANEFKTKFFDSFDSHNVLVLLKSPFFIYGTVKVTLLAGHAEVFGYKLEKWRTHKLYSPRGVCALQILPLSRKSTQDSPPNTNDELHATIGIFINECEFLQKHLNKMIENFEPTTDAILLLERNNEADNIKRVLQIHMQENIFPAQIPQSRQFYTSEFLLDCMINKETEYPLHIPPQWHKLRLEADSKVILVGGKSVGKSTLLRFLVNQHLNRFPAVLVIDLDIGQPEIFTSQAVSCALVQEPLLGPGFFYNIQPDKAFCVAHSNVVLCAHRYMPAVLELLQYCKEKLLYSNIPWIVNTMGYNKGFGAELIAVICEHLQPTDIVQLQSNVPINNFDFAFEPSVFPTIERNIFHRQEYIATNTTALNHRLYMIPSAVLQQGRFQREWQMSAKDMRYIMILTQLSQILNENSEILNQNNTYCVNMDKIKITNPLSNRTSTVEVAKSLVSNLVYLGRNDTEKTELDTIECFGIGIVRAIDWPARKLYLLTALSLDRLKSVNVLTSGEMPLPASMLKLQNFTANVEVPFVQNVPDEAVSRAVRQFYART